MKEAKTLWIMGPTSSGKTTIASRLLEIFKKNGIPSIHYDGDEIRNLFGKDLGFESEDRLRVVKALVHFTNKSLHSGQYVLVSALTANKDARDYVYKNVANLIIIYLKCSILKCIERDPKGLYKNAQKGEIDTLIGYNSNYLPPDNPHIVIDTENNSIESCINTLKKELAKFEIRL